MKVLELTDDAVYIQYRNKKQAPTKEYPYAGMDWLLLAKQKVTLLKLMSTQMLDYKVVEHLAGIVDLIDSIQDDAESKNYPVVWAHDADEYRDGELVIEEDDE